MSLISRSAWGSNSKMTADIAEFARELSIEAGKILLRGFRSSKTIVSYKSNTNLVTDADRASEDFLVSQISERFPQHAIIAEEGSRKDAPGGYIWYVDPLDGTNNFAHGLPFFCVSLGIYSIQLKRVVVGVVYNPFLNEMFTAIRGSGAFLTGDRIRVSSFDGIATY